MELDNLNERIEKYRLENETLAKNIEEKTEKSEFFIFFFIYIYTCILPFICIYIYI